jgi:integrase
LNQLITQKLLSKIEPPAQGNRLFFDREIRGFAVRVTAKGAIAFVLNYHIRRRERRYTIGRHPELSVAEARDEAIELRKQIKKGRDPLEARVSDREAPTMKELADDYFEFYANKNKRASSIRNDRQMLENVILPKFGRHSVSAITHRDIESLHSSLRGTPYQANRVLSLLSKMFSLANEWHAQNPVWRADNPVANVEHFPEQKRERWLREDEIGRLTEALAKHPNQDAANAIRLVLLTGSRKGEVLNSSWEQFDLESGIWTKPSAHTKQKRTEHLPLSKAALALLREMRKESSVGYLFPGRRPGKPLGNLSKVWAELCKNAQLDKVRIHDLRHTYASHLVSSGVPLAVVGKLLGHTQSQTTERYAHLAESPLREATNRFGKLVTKRRKRRES